MDHDFYDKRKYPIVDVQEGYGEWVRTYEDIVQDEMDLRLLERVTQVDWSSPKNILDLACGTGRIGVWLRERTSAPIDGIDITEEMLQRARDKGVYRNLTVGDITQTGLSAASYDLLTQSLADEHLPDLKPLYAEAARLATSDGRFVLVGFHPHFLMAGIPTHFEKASGETVTIRSYVHLMSDHVKAAHAAGWTLLEMDEGLVDAEYLRAKPKWQKYAGMPISFVMVWVQWLVQSPPS
jgi:ubiquinone/menaquinone biosynthesis C-methylase UbiE